jgi:hypothetical protein
MKPALFGQAPSDQPEFAGLVVQCDSICLDPDSVPWNIPVNAGAEQRLDRAAA